MMTIDEVIGLADRLQVNIKCNDKVYLAIPLPEGTSQVYVNRLLKGIKEAGYRSMLRTTEFGDEVVVTDKVG